MTATQTLVLANGRFLTQDPQQPEVDCIAIAGGRIAFAGAERDLRAPVGAERVDLGGRAVVPGFVDSHTHAEMVTKSSWHVRLPWTQDVTELLDFIRAYAEEHPREEAPFLYFEYYPSTLFAEGSAPTKELLDTAVSDRPVLCQDFSEHEHWVNSRMLELLGVTRETPDPVPGLEMFVRDADGEPTGLLRELVHLRFIDRMYEAIGWTPPEEVTPERLRPFVTFMSEHGVTALFDALVMDDATLGSLAELAERGELPLRYEGAVRFRSRADLPDAIARAQQLDARYGGELVRVNTLKLFLDGTNESGNSAVLEELCGPHEPGDFGEIQMEAAELQACFELCSRERIDVHIHLVGDRAFRTACDAAEAAMRALAAAGEAWATRITFAHCELVDPADMHRPAELGIFVNWTPHWSGAYFGEGALEHLGAERWNRMYDFTAIASHGAVVTFGSDVVTSYELHRAAPFFGMQVAHSRVDPEYPLAPERYPGSVRPDGAARLPLALLLEGYTSNGARQLRIDDRVGSLTVGKDATLNVLSTDPFAVDESNLATVRCETVLFQGRTVFGTLPTG